MPLTTKYARVKKAISQPVHQNKFLCYGSDHPPIPQLTIQQWLRDSHLQYINHFTPKIS